MKQWINLRLEVSKPGLVEVALYSVTRIAVFTNGDIKMNLQNKTTGHVQDCGYIATVPVN
jgi:hypothetical protein